MQYFYIVDRKLAEKDRNYIYLVTVDTVS